MRPAPNATWVPVAAIRPRAKVASGPGRRAGEPSVSSVRARVASRPSHPWRREQAVPTVASTPTSAATDAGRPGRARFLRDERGRCRSIARASPDSRAAFARRNTSSGRRVWSRSGSAARRSERLRTRALASSRGDGANRRCVPSAWMFPSLECCSGAASSHQRGWITGRRHQRAREGVAAVMDRRLGAGTRGAPRRPADPGSAVAAHRRIVLALARNVLSPGRAGSGLCPCDFVARTPERGRFATYDPAELRGRKTTWPLRRCGAIAADVFLRSRRSCTTTSARERLGDVGRRAASATSHDRPSRR